MMSNGGDLLPQHVTIAGTSLGNRKFQLHFTLMGPPSCEWPGIDENAVMNWGCSSIVASYLACVKPWVRSTALCELALERDSSL